MNTRTSAHNQPRRRFLKKLGFGFLTTSAFDVTAFGQWLKAKWWPRSLGSDVYFTTGFKVMEVGAQRALVWTRLCSQEKPNAVRHARRPEVFRHPLHFDESQPVENMDGGVRGAAGWVRMRLTDGKDEKRSPWLEATEENDFTAKFVFEGLRGNTAYAIEIEGKSGRRSTSGFAKGTFRTAPAENAVQPVNLVTSTCQYFWSFDDDVRGFKTYDSMRKLKPDFFIHTGDYVYYDKPGPMATTLAAARHKWHAMDAWPAIRELYESVPVYMMKDDHDLLKNDVYPGIEPFGQLSYAEGLKLWHENVPLETKPYRTVRWGKDLQVWMVEGREYRSANDLKDGPDKSIWGEAQKHWFMNSVKASDATFKLLFTATPIVGPDRETKKDNHANAVFETEGHWLREYLSGLKGMFVVNGDRHWQYVSKDTKTGLMEFGSGPVSDYHAQGWKEGDVRPEHRFLRLAGGFLNIRSGRKDGLPFIEFIHCDVDGKVVHAERFDAG